MNPEGYSLWGGSAGARMAAVLGNGDVLAQFGRPDISQAAAVIIQYTVNNGNYSDDPDFRLYLTFYPVPEGTVIQGAVLICPGGAFMLRSDGPEGVSVAQALSQQDIAVMGFSAGGILTGEMLLHWDGTVNPSDLDPSYVPDKLDQVSADAAADGMIYSFYERLSVGTTDVELLHSGELPPTFPFQPFPALLDWSILIQNQACRSLECQSGIEPLTS